MERLCACLRSIAPNISRRLSQVAAYPFTTLMPNLGVLRTGSGAEPDYSTAASSAPVLADLPGLIQGPWLAVRCTSGCET